MHNKTIHCVWAQIVVFPSESVIYVSAGVGHSASIVGGAFAVGAVESAG